jgi:putative ABC transport system ATP-binding protein
VALARALVGQPDILFADEPTGNLDGATGVQIAELLFDLRAERGSTLVLVTHDETLAQRCGRVVRMADGLIQSDEVGSAAKAPLKAAS